MPQRTARRAHTKPVTHRQLEVMHYLTQQCTAWWLVQCPPKWCNASRKQALARPCPLDSSYNAWLQHP